MTWFLRKSIRLSPVRLNLSRRGVGVSAGVTGARIGVDAAGKPYAAGGRHGVYVRKRLGETLPSRPLPLPGNLSRATRRTQTVVILLLIAAVMGFVLALVWLAHT